MRYCSKCVMPTTRPAEWGKHTHKFNEAGVCLACQNYEKRSLIDYEDRFKQLSELVGKYRRSDGYYDCLIPVSGGKDSHYLVYMMKEKLGMNPLLVNVNDPFTHTEAGLRNIRNISEVFNCDLFNFNISVDLFRRAVRSNFEEFGHPLMLVEAAIYTVPAKVAVNMGIPLLVHGENPSYEYGVDTVDSPTSLDYIKHVFGAVDLDFWVKRGFERQELNSIVPPLGFEIDNLMPIFMSYYDAWDGRFHMEVAKAYGFRDLHNEWERKGNIENYDQIDSIGYLMGLWMKFYKFGFARTTDIACRWIREGRISRDEAIKLVKENDGLLDPRILSDFLNFTGYTPKTFWGIVDKHVNQDLFYKVGLDSWMPKFEVGTELVK